MNFVKKVIFFVLGLITANFVWQLMLPTPSWEEAAGRSFFQLIVLVLAIFFFGKRRR